LLESTRSKDGSVITIDSERAHAAITGALTGVTTLLSAPTQGVGVAQPVFSAVLLLVADSVEEKQQALKGFRNLVVNHEYHALNEEGNPKLGIGRKASMSAADKKKSPPNEESAFTRFFHVLHHLYRPHHHPNHPPARYHTGIEAEVEYDLSYEMIVSVTKGKVRVREQ
jgi:hypothetical protein